MIEQQIPEYKAKPRNEKEAYFRGNQGVDRRFYETGCLTLFQIILAVILGHGANLLMTWGMFTLAMWSSRKYTWLCTAVFPATIIGLFIYRQWGIRSNKQKRLLDFLQLKIADRQAIQDEIDNKAK